MDSFIKKIFDGKIDNPVHVQFQKFSRGEFKDKAVILYSHSKDKYTLSTTYEYANDLVRMMAEILGENKARATGSIVSTRNLKEMPEFSKLLAQANVKQFAGVKQFQLDLDISGRELISLLDKFPSAFFALSMKHGDTEIKIKPKAPISGKPSTKPDAAPKADFCKFYTNDRSLVKSFVFDAEISEGVKKAEIKHVFLVKDIIIPKGESDPAKMRELAVRKGTIIRKMKIDGQDFSKEFEFEA